MADDGEAVPGEVRLPPPPAGASPAVVRQLREATGLPMMECRKAAAATGNDFRAAVEYLKKRHPIRGML